MKVRMSRVSILQSSKIMTAMYAVFGLIYTLIGIPMIVFGEGELRIIGVFYLAGPVIMAVFGFIGFVIFSAVYNLLASVLGGFEYEMIEVPEVE